MKSLAIITGASKGIGLSTSETFMKSGWDVANISRTPCPLADVTNYAADLADLAGLEKVVTQISSTLSSYQKICLVHNASVLYKDSFATLDAKTFEYVMRVNVIAPQLINKLLVGAFPAGSSVIFIGSTLSEIAAPASLSYTTSKHAIAGEMKSLARDLEGKNIHTCLICPGFTDTTMLRAHLNHDEATLNAVKNMVLMKRLIEPAEIASLIFYASNNPVINGSVLHANLGQAA